MQDRKLIFFTSDLHLEQEKSIEYDRRPFTDVNHMFDVLLNNWNSTVPPGSITYVGGDVGMYSKQRVREFMSRANGTKVLVLGNHDENPNAMYRMGFDVVVYGVTLYIANQRVTMTHCPLRGVWREDVTGMKGSKPGENWHGESKQHRFTVEDQGQFHLHGHIHSNNVDKGQRILGKQFDVGVVANKYRPVSISQIESWIAKYGR